MAMDETEAPRAPAPRNPWVIVALVFMALWVVALIAFVPRFGAVPHPRGPSQGARAELGWTVLDLDDHEVSLERFRGKPIFLNIWATWCPPCVNEMPSIARLAGHPTLKDVAFVCVSTDHSGTQVKRFLEGKGWSMTFLRATDAPPVFATDGIPATFIIDRGGTIVESTLGGREWDSAETIALLGRLAQSSQP
jgi:thiol-disulfide isomerase/thioredoxin